LKVFGGCKLKNGKIFVVLEGNLNRLNLMRKKNDITQEDFDGLLGWLSSDSAEAGKKYEEIRRGLINFFHFRGCFDAESLADETFNRVAAKLSIVQPDENFKLANYFYSFAGKIYLEDLKKRQKLVSGDDEFENLTAEGGAWAEENRPGVVCMEKCLASHQPDERTLLVKYYGFEKDDRAEQRRKLSDRENISIHLLQTKISRLRKILRDCLKKCLDGKKM
jgi:DNA-directed RNA polymerase specialized sigma24 family protein